MITLKGRVLGKAGNVEEPLFGATIRAIDFDTKKTLMHEGRALGTTTDEKGNFALQLPHLNFDDIEVSYAGFAPLYTDPVNIQTFKTVVLEEGRTLPTVTIYGTPKPKAAEPENKIPFWVWILVAVLGVVLIFFIYKIVTDGSTNSKLGAKLR